MATVGAVGEGRRRADLMCPSGRGRNRRAPTGTDLRKVDRHSLMGRDPRKNGSGTRASAWVQDTARADGRPLSAGSGRLPMASDHDTRTTSTGGDRSWPEDFILNSVDIF